MSTVAKMELTGLHAQKSIDDYNADALDAIAAALRGDVPPLARISDDCADDINGLAADIQRWMDQFISFVDYAPGLNFVTWEFARSQCHAAYWNGTRTSQQLSKEAAENKQLCDNHVGTEFDDNALAKSNQKLSDLRDRLHFWRAYFLCAKRTLKKVTHELHDQGMYWLDPEWEPTQTQNARKIERQMTAARGNSEQLRKEALETIK